MTHFDNAHMPEIFSERAKTKAELISALTSSNADLTSIPADFIVIYSNACYELPGYEIHGCMDYFAKTTDQKYKSYSFFSELYLLMFKPSLMNENSDWALIREALTYFDFHSTNISIGYVYKREDPHSASSISGHNLP